MRVLLVVRGGVDRSGKERVIPALLWLIERLTRRHQLTVIALNQYPQACRYPLLGAEVVNLGGASAQTSRPKTIGRLKRLLSVLASMPEKPHVIHAFWAGEAGLLASLAGKWMSIPVLLSIGGGELVWIPEIGYGGMGRPLGKFKIKLSLQLAQKISAGSQYALKMVPRRSADLHWLPLGVDCELFRAPTTRPATPPYRLIQVANLNRVKNQSLLLEAMSIVNQRLAGVELDLCGGDLLEGKLQHQARELGLENRVRFRGHVTSHQLPAYYQDSHIYVQSSLHESQGVAVCEAAATALPAIGTAVGLIPELAPQAALSVPTGDPHALADGIESLLRDSEYRHRLGQVALEWAHTYDADWTAREFEQLYEQLVSTA
jgi:glycosyltransferase involved in cell wall biosynthesis